MITSLKKFLPHWAAGLTALTMFPASGHAQLRSMPMQRAMAMRSVSMSPMALRQTATPIRIDRTPFLPGNLVNPFLFNRFGFDPVLVNDRFLRNEFGFNPFLFNRFGFDPLLVNRSTFDRFLRNVGSDPFLASQLGVNPLGLAAAPLVAGGATGFTGGGTLGFTGGGTLANNTDAGSLADLAKALMIAQQARGEIVANRRKMFDEYLYERDKAPTKEDERQRHDLEQFRRSLHNPPVTEILSGMALNNVLHELRRQSYNADMAQPAILSLDEAELQHINVTRTRGNIALLKKDNGLLSWPVALLEPSTQEDREPLASLALEAIRQAKGNQPVAPESIHRMTTLVEALRQKLRQQVGKWSPSEYIEANTFLGNFDQALVALRQLDAASHFNGTYALNARSVAELVKQMTQHGLEFARAMPGDEAAYVQLHQALVAAASGLATKVAAR
jgi:hypothetical protein